MNFLNFDDPADINIQQKFGMWLLVDKEKYPFTSMANYETASDTIVRRPVEQILAASIKTTPVGKDQDTFDNQGETRDFVFNQIQEMRTSYGLTSWQGDIAGAGGVPGNLRNEVAKNQSMALRLLKRNTELAITSGVSINQANAGDEGPKMAGLKKQISTSPGVGVPTTPFDYSTPDASIFDNASFATRAQVQAVFRSQAETRGGLDGVLGLFGLGYRDAFSDLIVAQHANDNVAESMRNFTMEAMQKRIELAVDIIGTNAGQVSIMTHFFLSDDNTTTDNVTITPDAGFIVDMKLITIFVLGELLEHLENTDEGKGPRGIYINKFTVHAGNPLAHARFRKGA